MSEIIEAETHGFEFGPVPVGCACTGCKYHRPFSNTLGEDFCDNPEMVLQIWRPASCSEREE